MISDDVLKKRLYKHGLKATTQRIVVYEALTGSSVHPTADQVIEKVRKSYPAISQGTIYKTLETFASKGLIKRVKTQGGKLRYDASLEQHHHLHLKDSGEIIDYYDKELNDLLINYFKKKEIPGFKIDDIQLHINGEYK